MPGLSGVVVQDGRIIWQRGFGYADVAALVAAKPTTPYPIINLSETIGATLLLQQCIDFGTAELSDQVARWTPFEPQTTLQQVLGHLSSSNTYQYDPARFGVLSGAVSECVKQPYSRVLATRILDALSMTDSVPGREAVDVPNASLFSAAALSNYRRVLGETAIPYRIGTNKTVTRSDFAGPQLNASTGLISTALDLVKFDAALDTDFLLSSDLRQLSFQQSPTRPTGLGWFVQTSGSDKLVWHFGVAKDAYSSLMLKIPGRRLTFILLANSDGLGSGLSTTQPNVTQSHFARLFLQFFAP